MDNQSNPKETLRDIPPFEQLMETLHKTIKIAWNIENKMHQPSIDRWLDNFTGEALNEAYADKSEAAQREKQLALFLLCNFVYYNESEVKYLARLMLKKYVHSVFETENKIFVSEDDIYTLLDEKTKFSYLGEASESSSYLLYLFRQENGLSRKVFSENQNAENVVFIDDFSISGSQAEMYLKSKIKNLGEDKRYYVLLMIATEEAIELLNKIGGVTVLPCIYLDETAKTFNESSIVFAGYKDNCKLETQKMCEYYGEKIITSTKDMKPLGFDGKGYLFGSYYNVPDNTLPIFWSSKNNWIFLFKRHDKQYYKSNIGWGGHYV